MEDGKERRKKERKSRKLFKPRPLSEFEFASVQCPPPLLLAFFVSYFVGSFDILCLRRCREVDLVEAEGEGVVEGVVLGAAICLLWVSRLLISSPCLAREQLCIPYVIS